jgi:hypothetical protein
LCEAFAEYLSDSAGVRVDGMAVQRKIGTRVGVGAVVDW